MGKVFEETTNFTTSVSEVCHSTAQYAKYYVNNYKEKISDVDKDKWDKYKEKIIEKEYKITKYSDEAIDSIVVEKVKNI